MPSIFFGLAERAILTGSDVANESVAEGYELLFLSGVQGCNIRRSSSGELVVAAVFVIDVGLGKTG